MRVALLFILIFLFELCLSQVQNKTEIYSRVSENDYWGYVDNRTKEIKIPLGKYKFMNPQDQENMILAKKDDKEGYIDINDNILIPFIYNDLSVFSDNGLAIAQIKDKFGAINRKGEVLIPFIYDRLNYFYKSGLSKIVKNGKYGFVDKTGKEIVSPIYNSVDQSMNDSILFVKNKEKWAIFNNEGKQLTDYIFDNHAEEVIVKPKNSFGNGTTYFIDGSMKLSKNGKIGFLDKNLKEVLEFGKYDNILIFNQKGLAIVEDKSKYGIINSKGQIVLDIIYDSISNDGFYGNKLETYVIKKEGKLKLLSKDLISISGDKWLKSINFREAVVENDQYILLFEVEDFNKKKGILTSDGRELVKIENEDVFLVNENKIAVIKKNKKIYLFNIIQKTLSNTEFTNYYHSTDEGFIILKKNKLFGVVDTLGITKIPPIYGAIEAVYNRQNNFIVKKNKKFGIIDINQKIIVPIEYSSISNWVEYGPKEHIVTKNGLSGLITREGQISIPCIYKDFSYANGYFFVSRRGKFGAVDKLNNQLIPFEYDELKFNWSDFYFNYENKPITIAVIKKGERMLIDLKNNIIKTNLSQEEWDKFGLY